MRRRDARARRRCAPRANQPIQCALVISKIDIIPSCSLLSGRVKYVVAPVTQVRKVTEANIFSRFGRVIRSYANALVSKAEDPEKMLEQSVNEMQSDLQRMRQASAQVMASKKQLEQKYQTARSNANEWQRRAELALNKGDEDLAREALKKKRTEEDNVKSMEGQVKQQQEAADNLMNNMKTLENKLSEAKSKKDTLKARAQSAKTQQQVNEMVKGVGYSNAYAAFEKMEEKVEGIEAQSQAVAELNAADSSLEDQFKQLEGSDVDDELSQMKKQMSSGQQPKGALPEGKSVPASNEQTTAVESELNDLKKQLGR